MNEWNGLIIEKGYNVFFKMWYHDYQRHTLGEPYCVTWAPKGQQFVLYINQQIAMLNEEWPFLLPYFTCLLLYGVGGSGRLYSSYRPYDRTSKKTSYNGSSIASSQRLLAMGTQRTLIGLRDAVLHGLSFEYESIVLLHVPTNNEV